MARTRVGIDDYAALVRRAIRADCEVGACANSDCAGDVWTVAAQAGEWRVAELGSPHSYVVRGAAPACPWCGVELLILPYRRILQPAPL